MTSPEDLVVSPDGRHVYVATYGSHAIAVFVRNRRTGVLEQPSGRRGCVRQGRGGGCAPARALGGPAAIAISPDGRNVYVAAAGSDALSAFARNRRTGRLRQLSGEAGCFSQRPGGDCTVARALNEPTSVAVSPDGDRVYVTGRRFPSAVAIFARAADGTLSQADGPAGCVSHRGGSDCGVARALSSPEEVVVSPDSSHVLVAASRSHAVSVLTASPGGLSQAEGEAGCIALRGGTEGCAVGKALAGPVDLAISPDGRSRVRGVLGGRRRGGARPRRGDRGAHAIHAAGAAASASAVSPGVARSVAGSTRSGASRSAPTAATSTPSRRR